MSLTIFRECSNIDFYVWQQIIIGTYADILAHFAICHCQCATLQFTGHLNCFRMVFITLHNIGIDEVHSNLTWLQTSLKLWFVGLCSHINKLHFSFQSPFFSVSSHRPCLQSSFLIFSVSLQEPQGRNHKARRCPHPPPAVVLSPTFSQSSVTIKQQKLSLFFF